MPKGYTYLHDDNDDIDPNKWQPLAFNEFFNQSGFSYGYAFSNAMFRIELEL
jgi:hypothetical protein